MRCWAMPAARSCQPQPVMPALTLRGGADLRLVCGIHARNAKGGVRNQNQLYFTSRGCCVQVQEAHEKVHSLELANYSLAMHLRQANSSAGGMHHSHPDVF